MRNRIVDSTWLGRGRHVLLDQVLTCQTTSNRDPFSSTLLPLSRLFLAYSSIHTLALASFHSLDRPLTRSLVHSHVPPNRLFTYPHTHTISNIKSFTRSLIHSVFQTHLSLASSLSYLHPSPTFSFFLLFRPFQKPPHVAPFVRMRAHARRLAHTTPTPATENQPTSPHSRASLCPVASPNLAPHPGQRNCMSKCQRHSVQLLTARTVNDRRPRRPLSPCRRRIESRFYHALLLINVCG